MISLIRHGQQNYSQHLNRVGIHQASLLHGHFDILFVSTLPRAIETLENSELTADEIHPLDLIREEGITETSHHLSERVHEFVGILGDELMQKPNVAIAVVSHGNFLHELMHQLTGRDVQFHHGEMITIPLM